MNTVVPPTMKQEKTEKVEAKPDRSEKLAEKMLQGWTLLGTNCPNCTIPLVRNRNEKKVFILYYRYNRRRCLKLR